MPEFELTRDMILMLLPLVMIQLGLAIYCIAKIAREGVANLTKWAWILICLLVNFFGPMIFLMVGRKKDRA